jgi:putative heme iron utilization protein
MILPLPDFTLFRLIPGGGLYVYGFGQAFEVTADMKSSEHLTIDRTGPNRKTSHSAPAGTLGDAEL